MIKTVADIITECLTRTTNCRLHQGIFPDNARIASVVPLDKGKPEKHVLNYKPVNILNAFSKIYAKVIKNQLVSYLISISLFLYQHTGKVTVQVFYRLLEE